MNASPFDRHARIAFVAVCATLLAAGLGFDAVVNALGLYLQKQPVDLRLPFNLIPTTVGRWTARGADRLVDATVLEVLGTDKYLDRNYALDNDPKSAVINVHLAYYTGMIDTVPHVPDRCMVAAGFQDRTLTTNLPLPLDTSQWHEDPEQKVNLATGEPYPIVYVKELTGQVQPVRMPVGEFKLRTIELAHESLPGQRVFGGYFFIANGRVTPTPAGVKALAFEPREKYAYYCKVQFVYAAADATQEKFLELVADQLKGLLPEIMRCLPDWAEVEGRQETAKSPTVDASTPSNGRSAHVRSPSLFEVPTPDFSPFDVPSI